MVLNIVNQAGKVCADYAVFTLFYTNFVDEKKRRNAKAAERALKPYILMSFTKYYKKKILDHLIYFSLVFDHCPLRCRYALYRVFIRRG